MKSNPLISLILCVKNGMPYLTHALKSIREQNYDNLELVVQDCISTDDSLDTLYHFDDLNLKIVSENDNGIGDAYNRAIKRCNGSIIGSIDSDNLLASNCLHKVAQIFSKTTPDIAAIYGNSQMINHKNIQLNLFEPGDFDLLKLLNMELVPPFSTSFFSTNVCNERLYFDSSLTTCADFDLWLRLSDLKILYFPETLSFTRVSKKSMSCNAMNYEQFCADKKNALVKYFKKYPNLELIKKHEADFFAGIYLWAAEHTFYLEQSKSLSTQFLKKAAECTPLNLQRINKLKNKLFIND